MCVCVWIFCRLFPQLNICDPAPHCGTVGGVAAAGCELEEGKPVGPVGVERSLEFSTEGQLKLTYKGDRDEPTGELGRGLWSAWQDIVFR